jgi:hypothetical protein
MKPNERQFYFGIIAVLTIIILFLQMCKGKKDCPEITTVIKSDTVYIHKTDTTTIYKPKPVLIVRNDTIFKEDTLYWVEVEHADTAAILRDYFATRFYSDSQAVQYGNVIINDSVSRNRITSRKVITDFNFPVVTNTVTVEKKHSQLYLGFSFTGNKVHPIYGFGGDLMLKTKRDRIYEIGALYIAEADIFYRFGTKFKLSKK